MKDPAFKAGFEMGIKAGERYEKDNPKRIDRDHEREGEEKYLAKDALPALLANAKAEAEKNVMERVKNLTQPPTLALSYSATSTLWRMTVQKISTQEPCKLKALILLNIPKNLTKLWLTCCKNNVLT